MTKQEKAEAKRSRRANRNHCGQVCRTDDCCGPGGFSEYGHWNASLSARAERAWWRSASTRRRDESLAAARGMATGPDGMPPRDSTLSPRAAQALAMVAALAAPAGASESR